MGRGAKASAAQIVPLWGPGIKYVLLDMDGTLLDKYFDDYFWEHLVPRPTRKSTASPLEGQRKN